MGIEGAKKMNQRLQQILVALLNPLMLVPMIILTYWACTSISASYKIDVIKAEAKLCKSSESRSNP